VVAEQSVVDALGNPVDGERVLSSTEDESAFFVKKRVLAFEASD
jgi:hypothetical protein